MVYKNAMSKDEKAPTTAATRFLKEHGVEFTPHLYDYVEKGGTSVSSASLGVDEHHVVKTLIMETETREPLVVLMHGDRQVSTKNLARELGVKTVSPCKPEVADRHSGYQVGGTSPFGTRRAMTVCLEKSIADLDRIFINGGKRGFLVCLAPGELIRVLKPRLVSVAIEKA
jgi:Cys-tRNA(Pro) deacylase